MIETSTSRLRPLAGPLLALAVAAAGATGGALAMAAPAAAQIEGYADYEPQTKCSPTPKPGTKVLARWLVRRGGSKGPMSRSCKSGGASEHKDGRAFDWSLDAARPRDRQIATAFLDVAFATNGRGHEHARARRMGIMYIIWNDHMYSAWDRFERERYLSSGCKSRKKCSKTLRHRDHMHISLSRKGSRGLTSWYVGRVGG